MLEFVCQNTVRLLFTEVNRIGIKDEHFMAIRVILDEWIVLIGAGVVAGIRSARAAHIKNENMRIFVNTRSPFRAEEFTVGGIHFGFEGVT